MWPANLDEVWTECQALGVDLAVQKSDGRRKRLLLADMDSTMIRQECVDELAAEAGVGERVAAITARAMNGELDFEAALRERVGLLAGLDEGVIARVLATRIEMMPGGATLVATMRAAGAKAVLVSGGFTAFTQAVAARLGFDAHRANVLLVEDGRLTGAVAEPILGREAKVAALRELSADLGGPEAAIAVGDGANDLGMLELAGTGVALHAKPAVQDAGADPGEPRRPDGAAFPAGLFAGGVRGGLRRPPPPLGQAGNEPGAVEDQGEDHDHGPEGAAPVPRGDEREVARQDDLGLERGEKEKERDRPRPRRSAQRVVRRRESRRRQAQADEPAERAPEIAVASHAIR